MAATAGYRPARGPWRIRSAPTGRWFAETEKDTRHTNSAVPDIIPTQQLPRFERGLLASTILSGSVINC